MQEFSRPVTAADMHMAQLATRTPVLTNNGAGGKAQRPTYI